MHPFLRKALSVASQGRAVSVPDLSAIVQIAEDNLLDLLTTARIAASVNEKDVYTCGIINAKSGRCAEDCAFCAQSAHYATNSAVYPMVDRQTLLTRAKFLEDAGASYMGIVISGTRPNDHDLLHILESAASIRAQVDIKLCASLGLISVQQAQALKHAGFTRYHHNLETSRSYYGRICSTHDFSLREQSVRNAKEAGLHVCSGGIFGLGENWQQRLELSRTLADLDVDSIPVNFLNPIPGTPLENAQVLAPAEALAVIAILRLMHPKKDIVICGGRERTLDTWENMVFLAGANGIMIGDYLTTHGSALEHDRQMIGTLFGKSCRN